MSTAVDRVLIVGGGLSGVSASIALQREGIDVEIIEREPVWGALGTGITLMGPAMRALKQLGVLKECMAEGAGGSEMCLFNADGEMFHRLEIEGLLGPDWPAVGGMMRPTLHRILATTAQEKGVAVRTGMTVTALTQHEDRVDVELSDGTSGSYDLLLGADGMRSQIRTMVFGEDAPDPQPLGQAVWRALLHRPPSMTGEFQFYGPGLKTGFTPLAEDKMYEFLVQPVADDVLPPPEERPARMRELLSVFGGLVAEVRDTIIEPEQVDVRKLYWLLMPAPWFRGRVLLIGDAAHATTPQLAMGGAIALEDGIVLGELLASETDLPTALEKFMERRYDRCRMVVQNSVQLSEWEKSAAEHEEDAGRLQGESFASLAAPI
ncbi:MAG TPA: FAD-dependent oxidoreductase [Solirubrobacteraceae bacterium]|nr:FAD-dependent oxidoreductase [Solirubrobacteraceae bacterium]